MADRFIRFKSPQSSPTQGLDPDCTPIFLFPGILGNEFELRKLAQELYDASGGKRPIYLYKHPIFMSNDDIPLTSLEEEAELLASDIIEISGLSNNNVTVFPVAIGGYSFGAILAHATARALQNKGHSVTLHLIDSASPDEVSAQFSLPLCNNNRDEQTILHLIYILDYAQQLARINSSPVRYKNEDGKLLPNIKEGIENLSTLEEIFDYIKKEIFCIDSQINTDQLNLLNRFVNLAIHNLGNLRNYQSTPLSESAEKQLVMSQLITSESSALQNPQNSSLGWTKLLPKMNAPVVVNNSNHFNIISTHAETVAETIHNSFWEIKNLPVILQSATVKYANIVSWLTKAMTNFQLPARTPSPSKSHFTLYGSNQTSPKARTSINGNGSHQSAPHIPSIHYRPQSPTKQ